MKKTGKILFFIPDVKELHFKFFPERNGTLIPITSNIDLPFHIERVFCIYGVEKNLQRGEHAHIQCHQVLLCLNGICKVNVEDGFEQKIYVLNSPQVGLYIPPSIWASQEYLESNTNLIVFTSHYFDEKDYIRNYKDFLEFRQVNFIKNVA